MTNIHHETEDKPSFRDCFRKGHHRERTFMAIVILAMQPISACLFILPYQTYFYELSGINHSFAITMGSVTCMLVACIIAFIFSEVLGRRQVILWGVGCLILWNALIGFVSLAPATNTAATNAVVGFVSSWPVFYQFSLGCVGWAIASEIQTQRLRGKTMGVCDY